MERSSRRLNRSGTAPGERVLQFFLRPIDPASLAAFRILFGLVLLASIVRTLASGWVSQFFLQQNFFFKYWGFEWVQPLGATGMYSLFGALAVLAVLITLGAFYRVAVFLFFAGFTYVELIDVTNYLNHYYLVSLLCLLMLVVPLHRAWSMDAWRRPALRARSLPAGYLYLLRFQVGVVYFFAGLAKLNPDWLLHAEPLGIWLAARADLPVLGPSFSHPWAPYAMSWAGFLFDTTIVAWLSWSRARPFAYTAVVVFHTLTGVLFDIGMFPFIMTAAALVFFSPEWPRKLLPARWQKWLNGAGAADPLGLPIPAGQIEPSQSPSRFRWTPRRRAVALVAIAYCGFQLVMPLRHLAYPGRVSWNEQGMRWSWKVMVQEKQGSLTYRAVLPSGRTLQIPPGRYLTRRQEQEISTRPDLILQLAHHIADELESEGYEPLAIFADARVSLNGRPPAPLIDPSLDLTQVSDGLGVADWVLPEPDTLPVDRRSGVRTAAR